MGTTPTCTTCSSESVFSAMSTALRVASSASSEPSVASRILVGKTLIVTLSFPVGVPSRDLCLLYQEAGLSQGSGVGTTPFQKGYGGSFTRVRGKFIFGSLCAEPGIGPGTPTESATSNSQGRDLEPLYIPHRHKDTLEPIRGTPTGR